MKYKTLFRLALRVIGVTLFFFNLPSLCGNVLQVGAVLLGFDSVNGVEVLWWLPYFVGNVIACIGGLYLFFGGEWIVNRAIPSNRPYCHECGYELTGSPAIGRCPECGVAYERRNEGRSRMSQPAETTDQ